MPHIPTPSAAVIAATREALFGIDKRIEELRDAAPPAIASRPSIHGQAP